MISSVLALIRFFYPDVCGGCEKPLPAGERWICAKCRSRLVLAETNLKSTVAISDSLDGVYSGYFYDPVLQSAIHHFKYNRALSFAGFFGSRLAEVIRTEKGLQNVDLIVPLPLHPVRKRERGFNQAELVAQELSRLTQIEFSAKCVRRTRNTRSQTTMKDAQARQQNVAGIFEVKQPQILRGRSVVVVDDLITTGATINECARALKSAGAIAVNALTIGRPLLEYEPRSTGVRLI